MTLDELDKNSKYGYRRKSWAMGKSYTAFSGTAWVFVDADELTCGLTPINRDAEDWYLSDIPNKFYKESVFPCFRKSRRSPLVVKFTSANEGTVIIPNEYNAIGSEHFDWFHYNDSRVWEPCEDLCSHKFWVKNNTTEQIHEITSLSKKGWYVSINESGNRIELNPAFFTKCSRTGKALPLSWLEALQSCSSEPITQPQKENAMDLRLLLAMMAAMSNEETPKDATNSKHVVIVTKDDAYEGYFYADDLESVKAIVAEPKNELKKFHVFDYQTTLGQKPRKVIEVERS